MKKFLLVGAAALILVMGPAGIANSKTEVFQLRDSPFKWFQCYALGSAFGQQTAYFDENVCIEYTALNSVTTRIRTSKDGSEDVGWTLRQNGSADISLVCNRFIVGTGNLQIFSHGCLSPDNFPANWPESFIFSW